MLEIDVGLGRSHAAEALDGAYAVEDAAIVGNEESDVGGACVGAEPDLRRDGGGVGVLLTRDVARDESESGGLGVGPSSGEARQRVQDPVMVEDVSQTAGALLARAPGDMPLNDLVAESITVSPGLEESAGVRDRDEPVIIAGDQVGGEKPLNKAAYVASV
jgi:hypothetical protein